MPRLGVTYNIATPLTDGDYIWRVSTLDQLNNQSSWATASTGFSIVTNTAPNDPNLNNYND